MLINGLIVYTKTTMTRKRKSISSFFVRDLLLQAKKTKSGFELKNKFFRSVLLCGTIVNVSYTKNYKKVVYKVEDGTGCINCYLEREKNDYIEGNRIDLMEYENHDISDHVQQIGLITSTSSKYLLDQTYYNDFKAGDFVQLVGNLRRYDSRTMIFIDKIKKVMNLKIKIDGLRALCFLYEHNYKPKMKKYHNVEKQLSIFLKS